jgi:Na+-transporting methylmalonyl-CoA/oxaloacetate decarboxylase gamma subunit
MFNAADSEKAKKSDLGLDLVFLGIAIVNLLLSLLSYYISR